jgi:hypothetical protein
MHIQKVINTFNIVFNTPKTVGTQGFVKVFDKKYQLLRMDFRLKENNVFRFT